MLNAIKTAGVTNGKIDRKAVNDALSKINYTGILGFPIKFTSTGDLAGGGIYIIQVKAIRLRPGEAGIHHRTVVAAQKEACGSGRNRRPGPRPAGEAPPDPAGARPNRERSPLSSRRDVKQHAYNR